jgi:hypothetical protein
VPTPMAFTLPARHASQRVWAGIVQLGGGGQDTLAQLLPNDLGAGEHVGGGAVRYAGRLCHIRQFHRFRRHFEASCAGVAHARATALK